jgi:hypothetical protein
MSLLVQFYFKVKMKKLDKRQNNYSTVEKECISLLLSLKHFYAILVLHKNVDIKFSAHDAFLE